MQNICWDSKNFGDVYLALYNYMGVLWNIAMGL